MFVTENLIFLQLQKTGCTYIAKVLQSYFSGNQVDKYGQLTFDPDIQRMVGSIRNSFNWDVLLWAKGCTLVGSKIHGADKD